jgi:hypothetical protein
VGREGRSDLPLTVSASGEAASAGRSELSQSGRSESPFGVGNGHSSGYPRQQIFEQRAIDNARPEEAAEAVNIQRT